jgi:hypothetical protein
MGFFYIWPIRFALLLETTKNEQKLQKITLFLRYDYPCNVHREQKLRKHSLSSPEPSSM